MIFPKLSLYVGIVFASWAAISEGITVAPENSVESNHDSDFSHVLPMYKIGEDFEGVSVYVAEYGRWDFEALAAKSEEYVERFWEYFGDTFDQIYKDAQRNNNQGIAVIVDYDGFKMSNFESSRAVKLAIKSMEKTDRFNRSLSYGFILNVNSAADLFLNLAKPFMGALLEKMDIYTTDVKRWKPALLRKIPASALPQKYGGSWGSKLPS